MAANIWQESILTEMGGSEDAEPTPAQWQMFERQVARLVQDLDPDSEVQRDARVQGLLSRTERQVDVLISGQVAAHQVLIACECKRYATKRIGIGMVDEMVGKVPDIGASAGIMYAFTGYTAPAKARADGAMHPKIELRELPAEAHLGYYSLLMDDLKFGDCPNPNCILGDVFWRSWPDPEGGPPVRAGSCNACGTLAVECNDESCGEITGLDLNEQQCGNCEAIYSGITGYKGDFEGLVRVA